MSRRLRDPAKERRHAMRELVHYWQASNQKVARKKVALAGRRVERSYRRRVATALRSGEDDPGVVTRVRWSRWPGTERAVHLEYQRERRARLRETPRKNEDARRRRAARRGA